MPRISQLPSLATADNADEIPIVDVSASTTKKITRGDLLKAPLPTNSVTTAAIQDGAVMTDKLADEAVTPDKRSGGFATGSFVRTSTGSYSVTGVGFKPKLVKFRYLQTPSTNQVRYCEGVMTSSYSSSSSVTTNNGGWFMTSSKTSAIIRSSNSSTSDIEATYVSMDADGFTINFTKNTTAGEPEWAWEAYA